MIFVKKVKKITVKVEDIKTGQIVKSCDCGTNQRKADKLESSLKDRANLYKYRVYQSVEI